MNPDGIKLPPPAEEDLAAIVAAHLTDRDRAICHLLAEHRVLTRDQITDCFFTSVITARHRLATLTRLRVVQRFRPRRDVGSHPMHYVLDVMGAHIAGLAGEEQPRWRRDKAMSIATSSHRDHLLGVNGFFTALVRTARHDPDCALEEWVSERRWVQTWGQAVRPDGYGLWHERQHLVGFWLEYDAGTERLVRLGDKLRGYAALAAAVNPPVPWVLFAFTTPGRETNARAFLAPARVAVATAVVSPGATPAGALWRPLGSAFPRVRLAQLSTQTPTTSAAAPQPRGPR